MGKFVVPEGLTEEEFVKICVEVSRKVAPRYKFSVMDENEMIAHGVMLAVKFVADGSFKPRGDKPMERQLRNFLYVWIKNRLINLRRDKSCRYPNKGGNNQVKYNIAHAIPLFSHNMVNNEVFARDNTIIEDISKKEILNRVYETLDNDIKIIYNKYVEGKATKRETAKLMEVITGCMEEDDIL